MRAAGRGKATLLREAFQSLHQARCWRRHHALLLPPDVSAASPNIPKRTMNAERAHQVIFARYHFQQDKMSIDCYQHVKF